MPSFDPAIVIALIALFGALINALVAANNARKRGDLDSRLLELKANLDKLNAVDLARVQAEHTTRLKELEFDRTDQRAKDDRRRSADTATLLTIIEVLQPDHIIAFLRTHDFSGIYNRDDTDPIFRFLELAKRPDNEFLNPELEIKRTRLIVVARSLSRSLGVKTHPRQGTFNSVLPETLINEERPQWVDDNAEELNRYSDEFVQSYEELVRSARLTNGA